MKQAILNAVSGDSVKMKLILQKTRQADILQLRYEIFVILATNNFTLKEISEYFNISENTVRRGMSRILGNKTLKRKTAISSEVIVRLTLGKKKVYNGCLYELLIKEGYSRNIIARHFGVNANRVRNQIDKHRKEIELKEFETRRKGIIKF